MISYSKERNKIAQIHQKWKVVNNGQSRIYLDLKKKEKDSDIGPIVECPSLM
jgi:hypothetical protein